MDHEGTKGTKKFEDLDGKLEALARVVVDAVFTVHKALGAGLLESAYQACLEIELRERGVAFDSQLAIPISYRGKMIDNAFRADLLVSDNLLVEIKAVEKLSPLHDAQLLTYLKLKNLRLGLLINFNVPLIRNGIRRIIL